MAYNILYFAVKRLSIFGLVLLFTLNAFAQSSFDPESLLTGPPAKQSLVNDYAGMLTPEQSAALERKLVTFDDSSSTQIAVIIVPTLGNYDVADYAVKVGRAWGIGGKEFSNGVILMVSIEPRKLNISTGYGVEGALPDITAGHIIQDVIIPNLKNKDYYRGLDEGTNAIIKAVKGEYATPRSKKSKGNFSFLPFIVIIIVILSLFSRRGGGGGGTFMSRRGSRGLAETLFWGSMLGGGRSSGGGWSGGGGGSSGGFGGFGGGSFGGGGASGSW